MQDVKPNQDVFNKTDRVRFDLGHIKRLFQDDAPQNEANRLRNLLCPYLDYTDNKPVTMSDLLGLQKSVCKLRTLIHKAYKDCGQMIEVAFNKEIEE